MSKACCVCGDAADKQDNLLFTCKGHGCDVVVHQACYGILSVPGGQWFCRKCESQERAARVRCELCPKKDGALKRTDSGGWAHVVCALYIPEVTFLNNTKMEPIVTSKLPRERFSKACYICEQKGQESHASYGAVMSCHKSSCRMAFHVTCAQKERLLCEEEDSRDSGSLVYCGYCSTHYKKMIQKKLKQNLRKQGTTPTSTVAPPLPSVATETMSTVAQPSPHPSFTSSPPSPHHKDLAPHPLPTGDHTRPQKTTSGLGNQTHRPRNKKDGHIPQKRMSVDAPIPPAKRKNRRRKLSSSNESSTSEALSNSSDLVQAVAHAPLEQARPLAALGEGGSGGGRRGDRVARREEVLHVAGPYSKMDGGSSHAISPVDVLDNTTGGGGGGRGKRSGNRAGGPPLSLQELLETQWQQTAQFILDQAGRQNNAGVMLEHLHKLQSENRTMQSRIMELASQREFYIAMNTRLRQTLADSSSNQLPNGIQTSSDGIPTPVPPPVQPPTSSSPDFHRSASGERVSLPSPSPSLPAPSSVGSLSKQDQESLLTAHFLASSLPHNFHGPPPQMQAQSSQPHPPSQPPPVPINAHHPSARSSESSPGGYWQDRQPLPPPPPHAHAPFPPHHPHDPTHQIDNEHRVSGGGSVSNAHSRGHGVTNTAPPYSIPVPMAMSEMDTLNRAHQQSGHGIKR